MELKYITCTGADEHTNIDDLSALLKEYPIAEIGIQVSKKDVADNHARFDWLIALQEKIVEQKLAPNLALHISGEWVQQFAKRAMIPELDYFLTLPDGRNGCFIKRLQVGFSLGKDYRIDFGRFCQAMTDKACLPIVLPYNDRNAEFLHKLHSKNIKFACLYNSPKENYPIQFERPALRGCVQGYSGNLNAENAAEALQLLSKLVKFRRGIYIEAENTLKNAAGHLDLQKCEAFIKNALPFAK